MCFFGPPFWKNLLLLKFAFAILALIIHNMVTIYPIVYEKPMLNTAMLDGPNNPAYGQL